jgi:serine/threonine protein kinase/Tfp pilus assembly protein PilF
MSEQDHSADPQAISSHILPEGALVGHFRIISLIGSGGLGHVYLAEDEQLHRKVAIKLLRDSSGSSKAIADQIRHEAQAAAQLNDPHIVTIYEIGEYQGHAFIAMEYIKGASLRQLLDSPALTPDRIIDIAAQVLKGLAAAHAAGVIHRDIKPHNIMIDDHGRAKICDFGFASMHRSTELTVNASTLGTIAYMSPEQVTGFEVDHRSDLFSLGVVLYRALIGKLPFAGEYEAAVLYAIVHTEPTPILQLRPELQPKLAAFVDKLLQKDAAKRFQSSSEALNSLVQPNGSSQFFPTGNKSEIKQRHHESYVIAGLLAMTVLTIGVVQPWKWYTRNTRGDQPVVAVLPFDNLGPPEDQYFADGITDAIITHLARESNIGVISRTSVMQYRQTTKSLPEIAEELGADYIVSGTIAWEKSNEQGRVRTNAALIRTKDDLNVWANSYDQQLGGIFNIQSSIAEDVRGSLHLQVARAGEAAPTRSLKAYDFYLRGNDYFNRGWAREEIQLARQMYRNAIQLDSAFALAWAMLSRAEASMYWEYFDRSEERKRAAKVAADRALLLQPDFADAHLALGYYRYHCELDYSAALAEFEIALQKQPNNAELHNAIAAVERRQGEFTRSVGHFTRSLELDPRSPLKALDVGLTLGMMRRFAEADEYVDRAIALAPDWALPNIYKAWTRILEKGDIADAKRILDRATAVPGEQLTRSQYYWWIYRILEPKFDATLLRVKITEDSISYYLYCAQLYRLLGRTALDGAYSDSARMLIEPRLAASPDAARYHSYLGLALAGKGEKENAMAHGRQAIALLPASRDSFDAPFLLLNLAEICVILGEYELAVKQLEFLLSLQGFVSIPYIKVDPLWKPLHGRSDYEKLVGA